MKDSLPTVFAGSVFVRSAKQRMEWELRAGEQHAGQHGKASMNTLASWKASSWLKRLSRCQREMSGMPPSAPSLPCTHRDDSSLAPVLPVLRAEAAWSHNCCSTAMLPTSSSRSPTTCKSLEDRARFGAHRHPLTTPQFAH